MTESKDRIKTPDQWTKTIGQHEFEGTITEIEGEKLVPLRLPSQWQGRRVILDASRRGKLREPTGPFRIEYVLQNPYALFDDSNRLPGATLEQTGLKIPDSFAVKSITFSYRTDATGAADKEAVLSWKLSEGQVTRVILKLDEADKGMALKIADNFISNVLDYISFSKEIPIDIHHAEVYESKTNDLVLAYVLLAYKPQVELSEQLLSGGLGTPKLLVPLLRMFREALNSTNPYYRLLCLYRVAEGLKKTVRVQNNQKMKQRGSAWKRPKQRIPENEFTKQSFSNWIGRPMEDFIEHVEHNFRKYIAHLIIDDSLSWIPDPGTTQHATETDKINSMLVSIVRQLIVDEWTLMKENDLI